MAVLVHQERGCRVCSRCLPRRSIRCSAVLCCTLLFNASVGAVVATSAAGLCCCVRQAGRCAGAALPLSLCCKRSAGIAVCKTLAACSGVPCVFACVVWQCHVFPVMHGGTVRCCCSTVVCGVSPQCLLDVTMLADKELLCIQKAALVFDHRLLTGCLQPCC